MSGGARLTRTWKRTTGSWLLAMKLASRTPRLNQLPRQRKTLISIFSLLPAFSTHDACKEQPQAAVLPFPAFALRAGKECAGAP